MKIQQRDDDIVKHAFVQNVIMIIIKKKIQTRKLQDTQFSSSKQKKKTLKNNFGYM